MFKLDLGGFRVNLDEILDGYADHGKPVVPFLMAKWSNETPAEILLECKNRGWEEVKVKRDGITYVGWRHVS